MRFDMDHVPSHTRLRVYSDRGDASPMKVIAGFIQAEIFSLGENFLAVRVNVRSLVTFFQWRLMSPRIP